MSSDSAEVRSIISALVPYGRAVELSVLRSRHLCGMQKMSSDSPKSVLHYQLLA
jgi:pheromone shutdown protein TraB